MPSRIKTLFILHLLLMVYSVSGILSKLAAGVDFLSWQFVGLYMGIIALLGLYALGWQQILKRLPLTTAFSNKAIAVVWGIIWGTLFFGESITISKVIGAVLIIAGVILFAHADSEITGDSRSTHAVNSSESSSTRSDILGDDRVMIDG